MEHGESCGRDLKLAADRVSQSEQELEMMTILRLVIGLMDFRENHLMLMKLANKCYRWLCSFPLSSTLQLLQNSIGNDWCSTFLCLQIRQEKNCLFNLTNTLKNLR